MRTKITIALLVLATGFSASAELVINEWNVNDGDKWEEYVEGSIRILESDEDAFCFEAYDSVTGRVAHPNGVGARFLTGKAFLSPNSHAGQR